MHEVAQRTSKRQSLQVDFFCLNGFESYYKFTRDKNDEKGVTQEKYRRAKRAERWPGEMSQGYATFSPLQTTSRLASLVDQFFSPTPIFSPFSPNAEPGPRLTPNRPYGCQSRELRLDLTIKYFLVNLHVHVPGNASIRTCTATFLVCDFSISDLGFLDSSRSFPLGHIASFSSSR